MIGYALEAARDIVRHQVGLSRYSARAGRAFADALELCERRIEARPETYRRLSDGKTRRYSFRVNRTSYLVDYQIEPDLIVILRVWHGDRIGPPDDLAAAETLSTSQGLHCDFRSPSFHWRRNIKGALPGGAPYIPSIANGLSERSAFHGGRRPFIVEYSHARNELSLRRERDVR